MKIKQWGKENLTTLSIESMSEYIHKTILPALVKETNDNTDEDKSEIYDNKLKTILKQYGLTCVSPPMVYQ